MPKIILPLIKRRRLATPRATITCAWRPAPSKFGSFQQCRRPRFPLFLLGGACRFRNRVLLFELRDARAPSRTSVLPRRPQLRETTAKLTWAFFGRSLRSLIFAFGGVQATAFPSCKCHAPSRVTHWPCSGQSVFQTQFCPQRPNENCGNWPELWRNVVANEHLPIFPNWRHWAKQPMTVTKHACQHIVVFARGLFTFHARTERNYLTVLSRHDQET